MAHEADRTIDDYIRRLLWSLQSLEHDDRRGIAGEIRSHLTDCAECGEAALAAALAGLGTPHGLARRYIEEYELAGAVGRAAPGRLMVAMLGRASQSLVAMAAVFGTMTLYLFGLVLAGMAILKPFAPDQVGAWHGARGWQIGIAAQPPGGGVELAGYWIIPLSIALALGCYLAGTRVLRAGGGQLLRRQAAA